MITHRPGRLRPSSIWSAAAFGIVVFALISALTTPAYATARQALPPRAAPTDPGSGALADVTEVEQDGDTYTFHSGPAALRVVMIDDDLVRIWLAPDGAFTDPANTPPATPGDPSANLIVGDTTARAGSVLSESPGEYVISTDALTLTVTKNPLTLSMADAQGKVLWQEAQPLSWTPDGVTQQLRRGATEQFFGGGMQNGAFSHRDTTIGISPDGNWNEGGHPNAAPFYLSSNGYGVLRNTFAGGEYDFGDPVSTLHQEARFDAFVMAGDTRRVIDRYTELTGRPLMVPMYALELGDADCYLNNANRGPRRTLEDARKVAQGYVDAGMPAGWMLVNDGYGCGYEDLAATADALNDRDIELGLWTEADLTEQESEVAAGVRVRKTDVAWVGPGYRLALSACEKSRSGIEQNSTDRAFVLTIEGWAGTQRCGATWSGDQSGGWDYIKWQIPTYAGASLSGQHLATGDVDGIFGGSPDTYTRDLQWKMLLPNTYAMSGWAPLNKQPYAYDEQHVAINRDYLLLHEQLLPYLYTHTAAAARTGLGSTRPLYVNYPDDPNTWGEAVKHQFLAGDDLLVAPVYEDADTRSGIYLPQGTWVDYWTGRTYEGPLTLDDYPAPLDRLPLFVRGGAIVPMFAPGTTDWLQGKQSGRLDLDLYPQGDSEFTLYEDDGRSQSWAAGESATQRFTMTAPEHGAGPVVVGIGELAGDYEGRPQARSYRLTVHTDKAPAHVSVAGTRLAKVSDPDPQTPGWSYDRVTGEVTVQTAVLSTSAKAEVRLDGAAAVGGVHPDSRQIEVTVKAPDLALPGDAFTATVEVANHSEATITDAELTMDVAEGWTATINGSTGQLKPGDTASVAVDVVAPPNASAGRYELSATYRYRVRDVTLSRTGTASTDLAHASLDQAFNNVGVTSLADPTPGDIDGERSSFIAERLAAEGVEPGKALTLNGFDFTWPSVQPGTPDNVASQGQTIRLSGQGNVIALLGTGTSGSADGSATVHYTDGTTEQVVFGFPNWCCLATDTYRSEIAVTTLGKNTPTGERYSWVEYRLYTKTAQIDPDRTVAAVTMPRNGAVHVFAWTVGTQVIVGPPIEDGTYQLTNEGTGLALQAPGGNAAQIGTGPASNDPSQKWVFTRQRDDSYEIRNVGSDMCLDVFWSSQSAGSLVGQYYCGSNQPNQRFTVAKVDGNLTLTAVHSRQVVMVDGAGLVVQNHPTTAPEQRWTPAPA